MKRRILGTIAAVSFALMLAAVALWLDTRASYRNLRFERTTDVEGSRPTWESIDISSSGGLFQVGRMRMTNWPNGTRQAGWHVSSDKSPGVGVFLGEGWLGFRYFDRTWDATPSIRRRTTGVLMPLWFVVLVFSIAPALWTRSALRRRRLVWRESHGLCVACGYDLRASEGACPECGLAQQTRA